MSENFQPAGVLGDQEDSDLEYMDFGDSTQPQKQRTAHSYPQYVPKYTGGFGLPEKKKRTTNGSTRDQSDGGRVSKAKYRKKHGSSLPTDAMANDNFRVACSRGNLEELRTHLVNGVCVCFVYVCVWLYLYWIVSNQLGILSPLSGNIMLRPHDH